MLTKVIVAASFTGALVLGALGLQAHPHAAPGSTGAGIVAVNAGVEATRAGRTQEALDCAASPTCNDPALLNGSK